MVGKSECPEDDDHECPKKSPAKAGVTSCIRCWNAYMDDLSLAKQLFVRVSKDKELEGPEEPINKEEYERTVREARAIFKGLE